MKELENQAYSVCATKTHAVAKSSAEFYVEYAASQNQATDYPGKHCLMNWPSTYGEIWLGVDHCLYDIDGKSELSPCAQTASSSSMADNGSVQRSMKKETVVLPMQRLPLLSRPSSPVHVSTIHPLLDPLDRILQIVTRSTARKYCRMMKRYTK